MLFPGNDADGFPYPFDGVDGPPPPYDDCLVCLLVIDVIDDMKRNGYWMNEK
jgi:hypothetical protein